MPAVTTNQKAAVTNQKAKEVSKRTRQRKTAELVKAKTTTAAPARKAAVKAKAKTTTKAAAREKVAAKKAAAAAKTPGRITKKAVHALAKQLFEAEAIKRGAKVIEVPAHTETKGGRTEEHAAYRIVSHTKDSLDSFRKDNLPLYPKDWHDEARKRIQKQWAAND